MRAGSIFLFCFLITACGGSERQSVNEHVGHNKAAANSATSPAANNSDQPANMATHTHARSSPGAASAPLELQFLDTMIAHHQGAIDMALLAESRASRAEVKELAANIIDEQEREIGKMTEWRNGWFDGKPEAINMEFPGMTRGMDGMDLKKLASLHGNDFDVEFIRQMIPHHEGAIEMAKALKNGNVRPELRELADDIIKAQQAEIKQMREWQ